MTNLSIFKMAPSFILGSHFRILGECDCIWDFFYLWYSYLYQNTNLKDLSTNIWHGISIFLHLKWFQVLMFSSCNNATLLCLTAREPLFHAWLYYSSSRWEETWKFLYGEFWICHACFLWIKIYVKCALPFIFLLFFHSTL